MTAAPDAQLKGDIQRIVHEVLARLTSAHASGEQNTEDTVARGLSLPIAERLVTLATLEGRLDGALTVAVREDAVVTPAARDLLRAANVTIERQGLSAATAQLGLRRVVGVAETSFDPTAALAAPGRSGVAYERLARVGLVGVVDELAERVARDGALGLLFTAAVDAALCLANRQRGVRAVLARSAATVREARRTLNANLFVIDPQGRSVFELRQIVAATVSPGGYECGDECRLRLT